MTAAAPYLIMGTGGGRSFSVQITSAITVPAGEACKAPVCAANKVPSRQCREKRPRLKGAPSAQRSEHKKAPAAQRLRRRMPLSLPPSPFCLRAKSAGVLIFLFDRKRAVSYQIKKRRIAPASFDGGLYYFLKSLEKNSPIFANRSEIHFAKEDFLTVSLTTSVVASTTSPAVGVTVSSVSSAASALASPFSV